MSKQQVFITESDGVVVVANRAGEVLSIEKDGFPQELPRMDAAVQGAEYVGTLRDLAAISDRRRRG